MYSLEAYYFSVLLASMIFSLFYPIIVGFSIFALVNPINDSFGNYLRWVSTNIVSYIVGSTLGFMCMVLYLMREVWL